MRTILIADDKASLRNLVREVLEAEGFRVVIAVNGREALYAARAEKPDLILLDIMMPEMSGTEFLQAYRRERSTPVILLTARMEEGDKVLGLELGADDYVTKPFSMKELLARIHAVLRRAGGGETTGAGVLDVCGLRLDRETHTVRANGRPVDLTPSEFDLLAVFMAAPGRVFTRGELLTRLEGPAYENVERTVDVHIRNLRSKVETDPAHPARIETVHGVGYRLKPE